MRKKKLLFLLWKRRYNTNPEENHCKRNSFQSLKRSIDLFQMSQVNCWLSVFCMTELSYPMYSSDFIQLHIVTRYCLRRDLL